MNEEIEKIRKEIEGHHSNSHLLELGYKPLFVAHEKSRIVIVGHAPSVKGQLAMIPWGDQSGVNLKKWLGMDDSVFRNPEMIAHLPMDFYYQGKGKSGDMPPRKGFAELWHTKLLQKMPDVKMFILAGQYAQAYYLGEKRKKNLTETVRNYRDYLPLYFPIVHPSPLNIRWMVKNPWFEEKVIPELKKHVWDILNENKGY